MPYKPNDYTLHPMSMSVLGIKDRYMKMDKISHQADNMDGLLK